MKHAAPELLRALNGGPGLTGRRRYREAAEDRAGKWGSAHAVMVLQVEESVWNDTREGTLGRWVCVWRDATPNDVNQGELV